MKTLRRLCLILPMIVAITYVSSSLLLSSPASAGCCSCVCEGCVRPQHQGTQQHVSGQFEAHQGWMLETLWYQNVLPAMMMMTNQMSAVAMQQVQIIGSFMDAKMQMETQRLLQQLQAQAHKDYHPSEGLCTIGTAVRGLAGSERKGDVTSSVLSKRMIDRHMRNENTVASDSAKDVTARMEQFTSRYCNPRDNAGMFDTNDFCTSDDPDLLNKDIDYTKTIDIPLSLSMNYAAGNPGGATSDEIDVMAMATHLFGNDILSDNVDLKGADREKFLDYRSLLAKRSVAQNSFNTIVGMKTRGSGIPYDQLLAIMTELGVPEDPFPMATGVIGSNPSYYAQMEILTKKIFQNPSFYVNLYDTPANVNRKGVALQALQLMLLNDSYNSTLRTEMLMAIALENELVKVQESIQGNLQDN